jgi:hypothetical protein
MLLTYRGVREGRGCIYIRKGKSDDEKISEKDEG